MKIATHKDLRVWQEAVDAAMAVFIVTKRFPAEEKSSLVDQVRRSSRAVAAAISEAWRRRRYEAAFVSKLNESEGEAAETRHGSSLPVVAAISRAPRRRHSTHTMNISSGKS